MLDKKFDLGGLSETTFAPRGRGPITLEFQIDNTVGKNLHGWKKDINNGARATEMCPDIKAIGIWLSAIENS